ncbi:MAG: ABC transporter permease [Flavobacteriaceae bacterium]|nr:ABC transporter permease [Flavobacteriaceae bacterium]
MRLAFHIARRYLFSKKKTNIINILSLLSVIGVLLSTASLVIVLSVFNGFEEQILDSYNTISPDVKITAKTGKRFVPDTVLLHKIKQIEGVELVIPTITERAVLQFEDRTAISTILGLTDEGTRIYRFDSLMQGGDFYTHHNGAEFIVLPYEKAEELRANLFALNPIQIYVAKRGKKRSASQLAQSFKKELLRPSGVYDSNVGSRFNDAYALVSYDFAKELFSMGESISAWEVKTQGGVSVEDVCAEIQNIVGDSYVVKDRYQLNETLFRMIKLEKFFVFATLAMILLIAGFNIVGSLSMIIIDKKEDVAVLKSMGATQGMVKQVFVLESLMISLFGAFIGLVLGLLVSWAQWKFQFITMQESYNAIPFPIAIHWEDILLIILLVLLIGFLIALFTVRSIPKELDSKQIH